MICAHIEEFIVIIKLPTIMSAVSLDLLETFGEEK